MEQIEDRIDAVERRVDRLTSAFQASQPTLADYFPHLVKPRLQRIKGAEGNQLRFRLVEPEMDVDFILGLRLDPAKNEHLSAVSEDREAQLAFLKSVDADPEQLYFIIETLDRTRVGTVRLSDVQGSSFSWGSWILADDKPKSAAVESTLMVYAIADAMGFTGSHFEVRKGNTMVVAYHERMGAIRIREDDDHFYYTLPDTAWRYLFEKYHARLPLGVRLEP